MKRDIAKKTRPVRDTKTINHCIYWTTRKAIGLGLGMRNECTQPGHPFLRSNRKFIAAQCQLTRRLLRRAFARVNKAY